MSLVQVQQEEPTQKPSSNAGLFLCLFPYGFNLTRVIYSFLLLLPTRDRVTAHSHFRHLSLRSLSGRLGEAMPVP